MDVRLKRAYEPPAASDGYRVLIDRLWPRGVTAGRGPPGRVGARAGADRGAAELVRPRARARFAEFRRRYTEELGAQEAKLRELRRRAREGTLTLVFGARDIEHNDAVVLAEILRRGRRRR